MDTMVTANPSIKEWILPTSVLVQKFVAYRIAYPGLWVGRAVQAMLAHRQTVLTPSRGHELLNQDTSE